MSLVLCLLLVVLVAGCGSTKQGGSDKKAFRIVTSFYPMYIDVINITKGVDGVEVVNMTKPQTGCLHDYQLTTEDMKTLEKADAFVVNGAGMESFLDKVVKQQKNLKIIDASKSDEINLLKDGDEENPHVWLSVTYSIEQVKAITSQLCEADPAHADAYRKNALDYVTKLDKLRTQMHEELDNLPHKDIVTFHEAFPYLAKEFKLNVVSVIEREPGTEPTPQELEETIRQVNALPVKVLFTEPQYSPSAAKTIAAETGAKVYQLDPVVTGEANEQAMDAYIDAMKKNMEVLKEALQ
ncbi:metal ABC transporter substrate-binding protein [Mitsuokella sp. AF21-1AC]|uniref:metal ABC transporter substrate-binding protein n=1 Tax=Mitsuokella sp. AF21-1AC TaxID=2292235 RepID=UPI000E535A87|nr:metal ABC transporter substrate-binding protein [Mitsuokella sp. AF21-1AC]RGS74794.1 zinc ABC transporter substrate-binding protein [Mitsuokella sp. AF21-1AC]